ncbi:metal-sulfur cluster biosynthetic enzyme [Actinomycetospora succinea]|uniref:Metal-sulfur cluster biosynthetic enzyme n=1 Tax=Actinomycetospora succinea TaxID=663603 RepID=A0A4R6V2Q6_9PSEU|nr:iron-sulfur cluster assembly protein [Actinomycetospora succinea]TDQ52767.1 metal-sulfur cluster biosynthetic enzyme [Actinomycetospora succinea]
MTVTSDAPAALVAGAWEALRTVRDPELDADVVSLDFVAECSVTEDGVAHVRLRLPTYFCAPNFAFLMVADAWDALSQVEGLSDVDVTLIDHFASDAINAGVAARAGFVSSMAGTEVGEAVEELHDLRRSFTERAMMAGTDLVVRPMMRAGATPEQVAGMTLADAPDSDDLRRLRARRRELGIPADDDAPLVVDPVGRTVGLEALPLHLRKARSYQVGVDANTSICKGQLAVRYGL